MTLRPYDQDSRSSAERKMDREEAALNRKNAERAHRQLGEKMGYNEGSKGNFVVPKDLPHPAAKEGYKAGLKRAIDHANKETERGEHRPEVGGTKDHNHSGS